MLESCVAVRVARRGRDAGRVKQILDVAHARDFAGGALDPDDLLLILELSAEDDDPAFGVDADLSLGDGPVSEELALDLVHEPDVVEPVRAAVVVRYRVREPDHLAGLVVSVSLELPCATAHRASCAVTHELPPSAAVARIEEELKRGPGRDRPHRGCQKLGRSEWARAGLLALTATDERWWCRDEAASLWRNLAESVHTTLPPGLEPVFRR
jgi:hypothetical protein